MADTDVLAIIDRFWQARVAGDTAAVQGLLAPEATYEMVGANAFAAEKVFGPAATASHAAQELIQQFTFHGIPEHMTRIVDGLSAATVSRITGSYRHGPQFESVLCDVWEFDTSGKITSLKQFVDTDLVRRMMGGRA